MNSIQPASNSVILEVSGLGKTYDTGRNRLTVFEGLSFTIAEGEMVSIAGPSGSGKSTWIKVLP